MYCIENEEILAVVYGLYISHVPNQLSSQITEEYNVTLSKKTYSVLETHNICCSKQIIKCDCVLLGSSNLLISEKCVSKI